MITMRKAAVAAVLLFGVSPALAHALCIYGLPGIAVTCSLCTDETGAVFAVSDGSLFDVFGTITTRRLGVLFTPADIVAFSFQIEPRLPSSTPAIIGGTQVALVDDPDPLDGDPTCFLATPTELISTGTNLSEAAFLGRGPGASGGLSFLESEALLDYDAPSQTSARASGPVLSEPIAFRASTVPLLLTAPLLATASGTVVIATQRRARSVSDRSGDRPFA